MISDPPTCAAAPAVGPGLPPARGAGARAAVRARVALQPFRAAAVGAILPQRRVLRAAALAELGRALVEMEAAARLIERAWACGRARAAVRARAAQAWRARCEEMYHRG